MLRRLPAFVLLISALTDVVVAIAASAVAPPTTLPPPVTVIEYYAAGLDHYFITADAVEAAALDSGAIQGWTRTGYRFTAYASAPASASVSPVCRFYGLPQAGLNSHFYSASPAECATVLARFPASWQFESSDVFQVRVPDLATGSCPSGTVPVYRLFNNRVDANHRYTSDLTVRVQMMAAGYISEGYGPVGVVFCAASATTPAGPANPPPPPPTATPPTASIVVTQIAADTFDFSSIISASVGVAIVSYAWSFGDGSTASAATASHQYTVSGTYPVVLTVLDSKGALATATRSVTAAVAAPPPRVPPGPPGSWTKYVTSYVAGTEAEYQSWYNLAYDSKRDVIYGVDWAGVISAFSPTSGRWRKLTPNLGGGVHNRVLTYDPINDRAWLGDGTGTQLTGMNYYDPVSAKWVNYPTTGRLPGAESAMIFDPAGKRFIVFGGWGRLGVYTFPLAPLASSMLYANVPDGPTWDGGIAPDAKKMTAWRSDLDTKRNRIVYVDTDGSLWALPLDLSGWQHIGTTGGPPPALTQYIYDRANDALVGWSSSPRIADGDPLPGTTRETWLLPLSTLVWTKGASIAAGNTVPIETAYVGYSVVYDPAQQLTILHTLNGASNYSPETWGYRYPSASVPPTTPPPPTPPPPTPPPPQPPPAPPAPAYTGKITSLPLPAIVGAPYSTLMRSKHTNMATDGIRLYVSGGDWVTSATDGTWSMSLADGSWRQDVGKPVYPTLPAPHALQDNAGFAWIPSRNRLLLWPGSYFAYETPGTPILNYVGGLWWYDPVAKQYTQDTRLFPNIPTNGISPGVTAGTTGSPFGGIYDDLNDQIVEFADSSAGLAVRRWDVANMVRLPDIPFRVTVPQGYGAYFTRGMHVKIGRDVYIAGYRTNGNKSSQTSLLLRWNLDTQVMAELAPPPVDGPSIVDIEIRMGTSRGKLIWPFTIGPAGDIFGIYVYDPATNVWAVDKQVPSYGNFIGNAIASLPDGRVVFSGGVFGRQQTHMWFYEAN
jgi:hypothetical protein